MLRDQTHTQLLAPPSCCFKIVDPYNPLWQKPPILVGTSKSSWFASLYSWYKFDASAFFSSKTSKLWLALFCRFIKSRSDFVLYGTTDQSILLVLPSHSIIVGRCFLFVFITTSHSPSVPPSDVFLLVFVHYLVIKFIWTGLVFPLGFY